MKTNGTRLLHSCYSLHRQLAVYKQHFPACAFALLVVLLPAVSGAQRSASMPAYTSTAAGKPVINKPIAPVSAPAGGIASYPRPAYQGPQVYTVGQAIAQLAPTNTGGAQRNDSEVKLHTLTEGSSAATYADVAADAQGNLYLLQEQPAAALIRLQPTSAGTYNSTAYPLALDGCKALATAGNYIYLYRPSLEGGRHHHDVHRVDAQAPGNGSRPLFSIKAADSTSERLLYLQVQGNRIYALMEETGLYAFDLTGAPANDFMHPAMYQPTNNYRAAWLNVAGMSTFWHMAITDDRLFHFNSNGIHATAAFDAALGNFVVQNSFATGSFSRLAAYPSGGLAYLKAGALGLLRNGVAVDHVGDGRPAVQDGELPLAAGVPAPAVGAGLHRSLVVLPDTSMVFTDGTFTVVTSLRRWVRRVAYDVSPALPAGLTLHPQHGTITGTPAVAVAAADYTIKAFGATGAGSTALNITTGVRLNFSYQYWENTGLADLPWRGLTTNPLFTGLQVDEPVQLDIAEFDSLQIWTVQDAGAAQFTVTPRLPAGLSLDATTGQIAGTPTASTRLRTYSVTAVNRFGSSTALLQFAITGPAALRYDSLITFVQGSRHTSTATLHNFGLATTAFVVVEGSLPTGITLAANGNLVYDGHGVPTASPVVVAIYATDAATGYAATEWVQLAIVPAAPANLVYPAQLVLTKGRNLLPVVPTLDAGGGTRLVFTISPTLPAGLVFDTATGAITGNPSVVALQLAYTVTAATTQGHTSTRFDLTVGAAPAGLRYTINSDTLTTGTAVSPLHPTLDESGTGVAAWRVSPALPAGLRLDANGVISGVPIADAPLQTYTIAVENLFGAATAELRFATAAPKKVAPQIGSLDLPRELVYGSAPLDLAAPASNNPAAFSYTSGNPAVLEVIGGRLLVRGVGTATITASQQAGGSYTAGATSATVSVLPAPLTIRIADAARCVQQANPQLRYEITGFVNGENSSVLTSRPQLTTPAAVLSAAGSYPITGAGAAATNYQISYIDGVLNVYSPQHQPQRLPTVEAVAGAATPVSARMFGTNYQWVPATGLSSATVALTSVTLRNAQEYRISVTESSGCVVTDTLQVRVVAGGDQLVPSLFSPNGDGVNDQLRVNPAGIVRLEGFRVFNQWGKLVFQTSNLSEGWDGRFQGQQQPMTTYLWTLQAAGTDGKTIKRNGTVTLVR